MLGGFFDNPNNESTSDENSMGGTEKSIEDDHVLVIYNSQAEASLLINNYNSEG